MSGMHIGLPPSHAYSEAFSVVWMNRLQQAAPPRANPDLLMSQFKD